MAETPGSPKSLLNHKFKGCSSISSYEVLSKLGEGTFGEVHKARCRSTDKIVALKKILMHNEKDGFPVTAIREIKLLKMLSHVNILHLEEMAVERQKAKDRKQKAIMYMVTPYMEHDLSGLLTNPDVHFTEPQIKCYMLQLLEGVRYLHSSQILHRDMKAANLLISNRGVLQIADFGLARHYDEPPPRKGQGGKEAKRDYTALVVTRWYRPPELLLSLRRYTPAIDLWGVGCVLGEMFKGTPILQGQTDLAQLEMIVDLVGAPTEETMPGWSSLPGCDGVFRSFEPSPPTLPQKAREWNVTPAATALLTDLLKLDWRKRITAVDALDHPYFRTPPLPAKPSDIPTFEDSHELDHRKAKGKKAAPPPAPAGGTVGIGPNGGDWAAVGAGGSAHTNGGTGPYGRPPSRNDRPRGPPPPSAAQYDRSAPPPQYEPRRPPTSAAPAPAPGTSQPAQRPGWAREMHELPPKPPPRAADLPTNGQGGMRGGAPPASGPQKDTYIPSYAEGQRRAPPDRDRRPRDDRDRAEYRDRDRDRDRDHNRDRERDREYTYRDRDRDRYRDGDRVEIDRYAPGGLNSDRRSSTSHPDRSNGLDYSAERGGDRDRDRERTYEDRSRKRTRSPSLDADVRERERKTRDRGDRERDHRERDRGREGSRGEVFGRR